MYGNECSSKCGSVGVVLSVSVVSVLLSIVVNASVRVVANTSVSIVVKVLLKVSVSERVTGMKFISTCVI